MRAFGKILVVMTVVTLLASCNLFFQTQVSFLNSTNTYSFLAIKLGGVDYESTLSPGQQTSFFPIDGGTYTLSTKGIDGVFYEWPVKQQISSGYSYTFIFSINSITNTLTYSTYVALQR